MDFASQAPMPSVTAWPVLETTPPMVSHTVDIRGRSQAPMAEPPFRGWRSGGDVRQDADERAGLVGAALDGEGDRAGLGAAAGEPVQAMDWRPVTVTA